jgi:hypothetical protein
MQSEPNVVVGYLKQLLFWVTLIALAPSHLFCELYQKLAKLMKQNYTSAMENGVRFSKFKN